MDLKTRIEVLPCGQCEDMIDCDNCLFQKEAKDLYKQIRAEVVDEFVSNLIEQLNQELPSNYNCTRPFFTLVNVRVIVDEIAEKLK